MADGVLSASHIFLPVAVETADTWNQSTIELIQEIGRRITAVTEDTRETVFLFQHLSIALKRGNAVTFLATFDTVWYPIVVVVFCSVYFSCLQLGAGAGPKNNSNNNNNPILQCAMYQFHRSWSMEDVIQHHSLGSSLKAVLNKYVTSASQLTVSSNIKNVCHWPVIVWPVF